MRRQFVLDKKSNRLLERLAVDADRSYSRIVREGIQLYAEREAMFDAIESDPGFIKMMEHSEADFRAGRLVSHEEVVRQHKARRKKGK